MCSDHWTPPAPGGFLARNNYSLVTLAVVAIYVALAFVVHVVFFGLLPVIFAVRAVQEREPLFVLAILGAVGALAFAVTQLAG